MNNTTPEKRPDKNGKVVTRHVANEKPSKKTNRVPSAAPPVVKNPDAPQLSEAQEYALTRALGHYGLTIKELPGLAEAWAERFNDVNNIPDDKRAVAGRHIFSDDERKNDDIFISKLWKDGGVYVVQFEEEDEDGYSSEEVRVISDPKVVAELDAIDDGAVARANDSKRIFDEIQAGRRTPWSIMANDNEYFHKLNAASAHVRAVSQLEGARSRFETFEAEVKQILDAAESDEANYELRVKSIHSPMGAQGYNSPNTPLRFSIAIDAIRKHAERAAVREKVNAAMEEAQALPDGALKDFLLADRPEESYQVEEGTGRNKKKVTKKYRPTSDLVSAHKKANKTDTFDDRQYKETNAKIRLFRSQHKDAVKRWEGEAKETAAAGLAFRKLGWTGIGDPPLRSTDRRG